MSHTDSYEGQPPQECACIQGFPDQVRIEPNQGGLNWKNILPRFRKAIYKDF